MLIPYSLPFEKKDRIRNTRDWDDPVRALYPHHAELWPAEIPEHHRLLALQLRLARKKRRLKVLKFVRWCLGRGAKPNRGPIKLAAAANDQGVAGLQKSPAHAEKTIVSFHDPMKREPAASKNKTRPDQATGEISLPASAAGCHGDCR